MLHDDELMHFEAQGATPLPIGERQGYIDNEGAQIWYAIYGWGPIVVLLHGGLGNSGNWGYQLPALLENGYSVVLIDSRGHGRSTRDGQPYTYLLMSSDVLAVMDALNVERATLAGWSDGACTALIFADLHPERTEAVLFFDCNMDPSGTKPFEHSPVIARCLSRHRKDYAALSPTPNDFDELFEAVGIMQRTEPNYSANDLSRIRARVLVVQAEFDEFIQGRHTEYLFEAIPDAELRLLKGVSHFAPVQRPDLFNQALLSFLFDVCEQTRLQQ